MHLPYDKIFGERHPRRPWYTLKDPDNVTRFGIMVQSTVRTYAMSFDLKSKSGAFNWFTETSLYQN